MNFSDVILKEKDNGIKILVKTPGLSKEDLKIELEKNILMIRGEKEIDETKFKVNKFIELNLNELNINSITASVSNGLLNIVISKKEESLPKLITIN